MDERINVCYGITDKKGTYSKLTGTSICSIFVNTAEPVTVHIIHDSTMTEKNRRKFYDLAQKYGQEIIFYDVSDRWKYVWERIGKSLPFLVNSRFTIGMFFRLLICDILIGVSRVIYLDSDTIVNRDIKDLWKTEISESGLAAAPDLFLQVEGDKVMNAGLVAKNEYFNSGVLLIDMEKFRMVRNLMDKVLNFILRYNPDYPDQDALNYYFPHSCTLPREYNTFVNMSLDMKWPVSNCIYHYVNNCLGLDMDNDYNRLYFSYFVKTPWCDEIFLGNLVKQIEDVRIEMLEFANKCAGRRRIIIGLTAGEEIISNFLEVGDADIYIPFEKIEECNFEFNKDKDLILVFLNDDDYRKAREMLVAFGLVEDIHFINMPPKIGMTSSKISDYSIFLNC